MRALLDGMTRAELLGCTAALSGATVVSWKREMQADVHKVFGGVLESRVQCRSCRHVSVTTEPFLDLSLEIARVGTVEKALERFTAEEILQGDNRYRCEACRKLVVAAKRFSVRRAPNVLTLHLKRFDRNRKDARYIQYPDQLDLAPYMIGRPKGMTAKYSLTGVLIHQGSSRQFGHYYAYVKGTNKSWCLKDDSTSRTMSASNALKQKAYLLFYTRIDQDKPSYKPSGIKLHTKQPLNVANLRPDYQVPPLQLSKLQEEGEEEELVLSEESSSEDEYSPTRNSGESDEDEEFIKKGGRRKPICTPDPPHPDEKNTVPLPSCSGKSISQGFVKRISRASPKRKAFGPMARRMEGKAKQSNAEAAKKATESMKDSDPSPSRRFLGSGPRPENQSSPDGDKSSARRTTSEPSLVQRKIFAPIGRRLSNNSAERTSEKSPEKTSEKSPEKSPESARRRFLSHLGRKAETRPAENHQANGESGDETEPSDRNSCVDEEEEAPAPSSMREVLISGGTAVRKVMHRVFGVAMPSPHGDKKKGSESSPPSPVQQRRKTPAVAPTPPSSPPADSSTSERQVHNNPRALTSSLFASEGVGTWGNDESCANGESRKSFTRSRIVKRRRATDVLDAEYDRGNSKKARVRSSNSKPRSTFGAAVDRRQRSEMGSGAF